MMSNNSEHIPVMLREVLEFMHFNSDDICVDCTFGAGGYSTAMLDMGCKVYASDCDKSVIKFYNIIREKYGDKVEFLHSKFSNISNKLNDMGVVIVNKVVFDLGVSSMQIDNAERGFSFNKDAPLDMRMDSNAKVSAKDFINKLPEHEMAKYIYEYGDEKCSRSIAKAIKNYRDKKPIETTKELADIIRSVIKGYSKIDKATRTFQAIRIWVNDEINEIINGIVSLSKILSVGGMMGVVTFHSGEDKVVKRIFKKLSLNKEGHNFELINKKVITAQEDEIDNNIRARSAKLRIIKRVR